MSLINLKSFRFKSQMDEAKPPSKDFLRHIGEYSQYSDTDRCVRLCACGHHQKQLNIRASLYTILHVLSVSVFERTALFGPVPN